MTTRVCRIALAAALLGPLGPAASAALPVQADYAVAHDRIDVGGGHRLNLYCAGRGEPSVVFDAGSGLAGADWFLVHPAVSRHTRACVYDRAGLGFSDPAARAGTSANAVDDLHRLLHAAGVPPPYLLVGHSYGGANVQLYAYRWPAEVTGLVLVDAGHEDENRRLDEITHGRFSALNAEQEAVGADCAARARIGFPPGSGVFERCIGASPAGMGRELTAAWLRQRLSADQWAATLSEVRNQAASDAELRKARSSFGRLPLVYLTHGISPFLAPGRPQSEMNKATERDIRSMHEDVARLSSRGVERVVPGAAHSIHQDRPDAVIAAVLEVLRQAREGPR